MFAMILRANVSKSYGEQGEGEPTNFRCLSPLTRRASARRPLPAGDRFKSGKLSENYFEPSGTLGTRLAPTLRARARGLRCARLTRGLGVPAFALP